MSNGDDLEAGLKLKLSDWEKKAGEYSSRLEAKSVKLEQLQTQFAEVQETTDYEETLASKYTPGIAKFLKPVFEPFVKAKTPLELAAEAKRVGQLKSEIELIAQDILKDEFYSRLYTVIPIGIVGEEITSVEEALVAVLPPAVMTTSEVGEVREIVEGMLATGFVETADEGEEPEPTELEPLIKPTELKVAPPSGIQKLTVDSIVQYLTTPKRPDPTLSDAEWTELLAKSYPEYADMSNVEVMQAEAQRIIAQSKLMNEQMADFQTAIAEMPEYKLWDFLKEAVMQPGLAALEVANLYFENVSQPIAAKVYKTFIPELESEYQKYRISEDSDWDALQKAWEEWDAPGSGVPEFLLKYMVMETLTDPLTLLSVFTLGTSMMASMTGKFGRFATVLNKANRVIFAPFEAPFTGIKWAIGKLPKTVSQRALIVEGATGKVVKQYMESMSKGKLLNKGMTMKDWDKLSRSAIRYAFNNPQLTDMKAEAGRALLKHKPIAKADVARYAKQLGITLDDATITPEMLANVNTIFEAMFSKYTARTGKLMLPREAGKRLLEILGLGGSDEKIFNKATRILERRATSIIEDAYGFAQAKTPGRALQHLMKRNFDYHIILEQAIDDMRVAKSGKFIQLYAGVEAKFVAIWQKYVEEIMIRPLAQSYLTFAMYGPMNVVEDHWRSILGGVFPRRMTTDRMAGISHGLSIDPDLVNPSLAMSESIGRMRRRGGDDEWNNWILQLAMVGQKDWADKLYTGLVRLPGGFGMDIRRNFVGQKYLVLFKEMGGESAEVVLKTEARLPRLADDKLVNELKRAVYDTKTTLDVNAIRAVKDMFTRKSIYRKEVQNIMKEHPDLPNSVRDYLVQSFDENTLYAEGVKTVNARMKEANIRLFDDYLRGASYATKEFQGLTDVLAKMEVKNPEEMAHLLYNVNIASDIYGKAPEEILAQATIASQGKNLANRRAHFDQIFDDILEFRGKAGGNLDELVKKIRADLKAGMTFNPEYTDRSNRLMDLIIGKKSLSDEFGLEDMAWRQDLFAGVGSKEMTSEWWQSTYRQMQQRIRDHKNKMVSIEGDIFSALKEVDLASGAKPFSRKSIKVVGRSLAPQDIASLIGVQGDDLSRALLDNLTIVNDREMFVEYITRQLRPGDEGFSRQAIGEVFDQIAYQARVKPESLSWMTSKQMEMESIRGDLHTLYHSKLLPDDEIREISRYVDETANMVDNLIHQPREAIPLIPDYDVGLGQRLASKKELELFEGLIQREMKAGRTREQALNIVLGKKAGEDVLVHDAEYMERIRREIADAASAVETSDISKYANLERAIDDWFAKSSNESLQTIGRAASRSPEYLAKIRGILKAKYPSGYIRIYRGAGGAGPRALDREFTNVTSSRRAARNFSDTWEGVTKPDIDNVLIKVEDVVSLGSVDESELIIRSDVLARHINRPLKAPVKMPPKVMKPEFQSLGEIRQKAMDEAHTWYYKEFTDYSNANAVDAFMKGVFPFWTYETQRWFWMPRSFVRHPGTFTALERWQDNTDYGYNRVFGTNVEINPFRGTVYGPLTTRLSRRDYPEYYDAWQGAEPVNEFFDWLSRYGFYLGGHLTIPMSLFGGLEAQTGEALPPIWETPLMVLQAAAPESDAVKMLTDHVFSDRFRIYMTVQEVIARGGDGRVISAKMKENKPLTEEEQAIWDESRRTVAGYSLLFENTGMFRLRHKERQAVYDAATQYIEDTYGYTADQQKWLRMHGHRIWDQIGGMSLEDQRVLEELEYFRFTGTVDRLLPGRQQLVLDKLTLAWDNVEKFVDATIERKLALEREFQSGVRGPDDYQDQLRKLYSEQSDFIYNEMRDMVDEPIPEGLTKEEEKAFVKEHSVMELEGRKRYYEKWDIPLPVLHPLRELLNLYYSIELKEIHDPQTGELVRDWDTFWAQRLAIEESIPDMWKGEFKDYTTKNETGLESIRRQVYQTYLTKYWWVWDQVLKGYNENEERLIREYLSLENRGVNLSRQAEIQAMTSEKTGNLLISGFRSEVSEARQALRFANPSLDAWLFYWGRTSTFLTPEAENVYHRIASDTGRTI